MQPMSQSWTAVAMDDSPSRAEPSGEGSRWKQAIIALPAGTGDEDRDRYSLRFFIQVSAASLWHRKLQA